MSLGTALIASRKLKPKLGAPDVYPQVGVAADTEHEHFVVPLTRFALEAGTVPVVFMQDPNQKEDDLSAVHVKQGFTTSYINLSTSDEYGSALSKAAQLQPSKIWNSFKDILVKKEELNTFQESKDKSKRQPINIRDDFWLVTGKTKNLCDKYFKELAGDKDYRYLAKKVPIFNKNEDILIKLVECEVPCSRGVWLIKMHAAYKAAMQEANKSKHKRSTVDPCIEWTLALTRYHWLVSTH